MARRAIVFNFLEANLKALIFDGHPATAGPLSRKLKEKFLCDLCDSSEAPRSGMQARAVKPGLNNYELLSNF